MPTKDNLPPLSLGRLVLPNCLAWFIFLTLCGSWQQHSLPRLVGMALQMPVKV